jgi:hypothetical protein
VILSVVIYAIAIIYLTWPIDEVSIAKSGVFGDSFGLLTSLFSGLAFAGLIITIVMQKNELELQREELSLTRSELSGQKEELKVQNQSIRVQRFENTFFKMLEFFSSCRDGVCHVGRISGPTVGREAIARIYQSFTEGYLTRYEYSSSGSSIPFFKDECKDIAGINSEYKKFYAKELGNELGQYFRILYNILKFIDAAEYVEDKFIYTNLLRAQLSRYELNLLFYNCISEYGKDKMEPFIRKYSLLKHLEEDYLPEENKHAWREYCTRNASENKKLIPSV